MRKALGVCVLVVAMLPSLVAEATHGTTETYEDHFDSASFSGNDGTLDWSGPWVEQGENDGPDRGAIAVTGSGCSGQCLQMKGGLLTGPAVRRTADLSAFVDARLEFELELEPFLVSTGLLFVEVREGGSAWKTVADYVLLTESNRTHSESIDISKHLGHDFEVRFRLTQIVGGDLARIDDVKIVGTVQVTTTSTTTTTTPSKPPSSTSTTSPVVTTVTQPPPTTTSTSAGSTSTSVPATGRDPSSDLVDPDESVATTTTLQTTTSTTTGDDHDVGVVGPGDEPAIPSLAPGDGFAVPQGSGLRQSRVGLLADFRPGTAGGIGEDDIEVLGVTLDADFSLAAEAFEATRLWIAGLALLIAIVLVSGMDMRWGRWIVPGGTRGVIGSAGDHGGSENGG